MEIKKSNSLQEYRDFFLSVLCAWVPTSRINSSLFTIQCNQHRFIPQHLRFSAKRSIKRLLFIGLKMISDLLVDENLPHIRGASPCRKVCSMTTVQTHSQVHQLLLWPSLTSFFSSRTLTQWEFISSGICCYEDLVNNCRGMSFEASCSLLFVFYPMLPFFPTTSPSRPPFQ